MSFNRAAISPRRSGGRFPTSQMPTAHAEAAGADVEQGRQLALRSDHGGRQAAIEDVEDAVDGTEHLCDGGPILPGGGAASFYVGHHGGGQRHVQHVVDEPIPASVVGDIFEQLQARVFAAARFLAILAKTESFQVSFVGHERGEDAEPMQAVEGWMVLVEPQELRYRRLRCRLGRIRQRRSRPQERRCRLQERDNGERAVSECLQGEILTGGHPRLRLDIREVRPPADDLRAQVDKVDQWPDVTSGARQECGA